MNPYVLIVELFIQMCCSASHGKLG